MTDNDKTCFINPFSGRAVVLGGKAHRKLIKDHPNDARIPHTFQKKKKQRGKKNELLEKIDKLKEDAKKWENDESVTDEVKKEMKRIIELAEKNRESIKKAPKKASKKEPKKAPKKANNIKKEIKKHLKEEDKTLKNELKENEKLEKKLDKPKTKKKEPTPAQLEARKKFAEMAKMRKMEKDTKKQSSQLNKTEKEYTKTIDKLRKKGQPAKNLLDRDLEELD